MQNYNNFLLLAFISTCIVGSRIDKYNDHRSKEFITNHTPSPQFDENFYYLSSSAGIWNSSDQDCQIAFGPEAHLLSIETEEEQEFISVWLASRVSGGGLFWTSGSYDTSFNEWKWSGSDQSINNFTAWGVGEPKSSAGHRKIAFRFINSASTWWETGDDTALKRYICEAYQTPPVTTTSASTTETVTISPEPTNPINCSVTNDLILILDSSIGVGENNFEIAKQFCVSLAAAFKHKSESRVGFLVYSEVVRSVINLHENLTSAEVEERILSVEYKKGPVTTDLGIKEAIEMFTESYRELPRSYLVVTSGQSNNPEKTKEQADLAVEAGIQTFSLGITASVNETELLAIAGGIQGNVFHSEDFTLINELLLAISSSICP